MNEWVTYALRGMIYAEEIGRCASTDTFSCQIPWKGQERICAFRWNMRYASGVVLKDGPFGKLAELQIDTIALQRGMLVGEMQESTVIKRQGGGAVIGNIKCA